MQKNSKIKKNYGLIHRQVSYQGVTFRARVDLQAKAKKGCSALPKPQRYWNLTIRLLSIISRTLVGETFSFAEKQSGYSTAPADWASVKWSKPGNGLAPSTTPQICSY